VHLLPPQLALLTALLAWRLRCRGWPKSALWAIALVGALLIALALPHSVYGWQVQQHVPAAFLRVQMALSAGWFFLGLFVGFGLWIWDAAAARLVRARPAAPVNASRRAFLGKAPLAVGLLAPLGVAEAAPEPRPKIVTLSHPDLPAAFDGFRILQISDLHLGPCLDLGWLDRALARLHGAHVDLVAITGDLSDDLSLMAPALARAAQVPAAFGHVAIPGNHEHAVGIEAFNAAVRASPFTLLTDRCTTLRRGGDAIELLGIDYPVARHVKGRVQFAHMIDQALAHAGSGFRVLLSHHPEGFDQAALRQIPLTLAGHTHGGQIEVFGVSPLSAWWLKYTRGQYQKGACKLWVTTGLGHWFPYRIDCPTELPVIELRRESRELRRG